MATRAKKILITSVSHEEAEQAMATFARCNTQLKLIEAKMEEEKQQVDNKFVGEISRLRSSMEEQLNLLQVYGQHSKDQWKGKSLELVHGKIGFRTGNPKLVKDKKFTWDAVTELLKKAFPAFVRTTYEINKEALISCREHKEFEAIRDACYVDVVQDESFYIEANTEELSVAYSIHR
ncbi:MAG TPA: host-nuclease inhibitor Gam family protein [Puia sp.]|nr:host-nuclease inhibitor Gam family protein [Puia sp.]